MFTGLHVLGHLPGMPEPVRQAVSFSRGRVAPGTGARWLAVLGSLVVGLIIAVVLIPHYAPWTAQGALRHVHH